MGIFDDDLSRTEFNEYKAEVEQTISELREEIKRKATDSEEQAKAAAQSAVLIDQNIKATESDIREYLGSLRSYVETSREEVEKVVTVRTQLESKSTELSEKLTEVETLVDALQGKQSSVEEATSDVFANIEKINEALSKSEALPEKVEEVNQILSETKELSKEMEGLQSHSMRRKSDIDELYKEINGYEIKGAEGEVERVDGLKDELTKTYDELDSQAEKLGKTIEESIQSIIDEHKEKTKENNSIFEGFIEDSKKRVKAVSDQLTGLLPGAMAEGLSAAYEQKKVDEIKWQEKLEKSFRISILFLVVISLIPFGVDVYLLGWNSADLITVIKDTPNLLIAILPLYFPVLWFAYSANKKLNLSKRLIEEYTHKAVLGKTFEGLSNQIETLPQEVGAVRDELRSQLLYNLLRVSSENPGKLITNYDKSDHPLMEALENSSKLSESVETLMKLPGFSAIANKLAKRSDELLEEQEQRIKRGLVAQDVLDEPVEEKA